MIRIIFILGALFCAAQQINAQTDFEWSVSNSGTSSDNAISVVSDSEGNIYVSGYFSLTVDFDYSPVDSLLTSTGGYDFYIQKLNTEGELLWVKQIGSSNSGEFFSRLAIDEDDNLYVYSDFYGTLDFDPSAGDNSVIATNTEVFILKLSSGGDFKWVKTFGGSTNINAENIKLDEDKNIYVTGRFMGTIDVDPSVNVESVISAGSWDGILVKLDSNGNYLMNHHIGSAGFDNLTDCDFDEDGNIYNIGYFGGTVDFDSSVNDDILQYGGASDAFIQKLDPNGNHTWVKQITGASAQEVWGVEYGNGAVYIIGNYKDSTAFIDLNTPISISSNGLKDLFVAKYYSDNSLVWVKDFGSVGNDWINDVEIDQNSNIIFTGGIRSQVSIDLIAIPNNGAADGFVASVDTNGVALFANNFGGSANDNSRAINVDKDNNIILVGEFQGTFDFDSNISSDDLTSAGQIDPFIIKLTQNLPTDIIKNINEIKSKVYPNPSADFVQLSNTNAVNYKVFDVTGKLHLQSNKENKRHVLNVSLLSPGIYFINVFGETKNETIKFIRN